MFPDTAKLYMAPIADSQCYDERFHFYIHNNSITDLETFTLQVELLFLYFAFYNLLGIVSY